MSSRRPTTSKKAPRTTSGQHDNDTNDIHGGDNYTYNGALGPELFRFLSWMQQYDRLYEAVPGFRRLVERGSCHSSSSCCCHSSSSSSSRTRTL